MHASLSIHLKFVDDTLLIGEKSRANVRALKKVLLIFEKIYGLKINFHKSMVIGINVAGFVASGGGDCYEL